MRRSGVSVDLDRIILSTILTGNLAIDVVRENNRYSTWSGSGYTNSGGVYEWDGASGYAELKHFPAGRKSFGLDNATSEHVGAWQITLRYPTNASEFDAKNKAEAVLALFPPGTKLTYSTTSAWIESVRRGEGVIVDGHYEIVITVNYTAYI